MNQPKPASSHQIHRRSAYTLIIMLGLVSLLGDVVYEGARSITGPYLELLGAGSVAVGLIAGSGELLGYALRLVTGYLSDRTEQYWLFTFAGYGFLISVPLLALAGHWELAAVLIILERTGKAIRTPARDVILSNATHRVGRGWGFGIHEALDQIGAVIGPLIFTVVFILQGNYRQGFTILWIPTVLMLIILAITRIRIPSPQKLESKGDSLTDPTGQKLSRRFWLYSIFIALTVAGFAHFQLIAFHFAAHSLVPTIQIPVFYAVAMATDAVTALLVGRLYDRYGLIAILLIPFLSIPIPLLVFSTSYYKALGGMVIWGIVLGIHETIMRAVIADLSPVMHRGKAYGIFNTCYGGAWLAGSAAIGFMYQYSTSWIMIFSITMEIIAMAFFVIYRHILLPANGNNS